MPVFDDDACKRIIDGVRYIEQMPRNYLQKSGPIQPPASAACRWFWTTASIPAATKSGTTVSTAVLTLGSGTARICLDGTTVKPDTTASDTTIWNGTNGSDIATGSFVLCSLTSGKWTVILAWC